MRSFVLAGQLWKRTTTKSSMDDCPDSSCGREMSTTHDILEQIQEPPPHTYSGFGIRIFTLSLWGGGGNTP